MQKIKKTFALLLVSMAALIVIPALSSCQSKEARFTKAVEQLNKMLPMKLGNGFTMQKVSMDGDAIVYDIKCDEHLLDMDMIEENQEELRNGSIAQLKNEKKSSKDFASLLEYCQESGKKIIYRYKGSRSGKTVDVTVEPKDI